MSLAAAALARAWAFIARDLREMASYRLAFVLQAYGVAASTALFYFIARAFAGSGHPALGAYGGDYFPFVLVGLAFLGFMTTGMGVFSSSIRQGQLTGTLEAMLVTPTSLRAIVLSSSLAAYLRSALNVVLYLAIGALFGLDLEAANWPVAFLVLALSVAAFSGLGIVSAAFVLAFKKGNPAAAVFGSISGLLSGAFFPTEVLPAWIRPLSYLLPLTYALDGMRRAVLAGAGFVDVARDLGALLAFTALILPAAFVCFRLAVRHAKREGSLAQY
jgi:ABC-2 type transport system permease protein